MIKMKTPWYNSYENVKTHLNYPEYSIYQSVYKTSQKYPDNIAYNYFNTKISYKQYIKEIDEVSKSFKQIGVKKGDKVAICMPNTPEAIISIYALNKIGAIATMIHPLSAKNEIKEYLNITKSKILLIIDVTFKKIESIIKETKIKKTIIATVNNSMPPLLSFIYTITQKPRINISKYENTISWKKFLKNGKNYKKPINENGKGEDPAIIMFSGGTTGKNKAILLSNKNFNAVAYQYIEINAFNHTESLFALMPIFHAFGLGTIHMFNVIGATNIYIPTFDFKLFHKYLKQYKPTTIMAVPTLLKTIMNNKKINKMDLSFIRHIFCGGDFLHDDLKKDLDKFFKDHHSKCVIRPGYGLTECTSASCLVPKNKYKKNSVGIPGPDTYFKIVKINTTEELPYNEKGEICISGPTIMIGYLNNQKETENTLKKHDDGLTWLHTGDIGHMDEEGWIFFDSRIKRLIVCNGYNIFPKQIEELLNKHEYIKESVAVGMSHPYKKEVVKVGIILKEGIEESEEIKIAIDKYCRENLSKFAVPYEYVFYKEFPKTKLNKIDYTKI